MPPEKRKRRPRDANQLAKAIVDIATGETEDRESTLGKTHPAQTDAVRRFQKH